MQCNDRKLIQQLNRGCPEALRRIYTQYRTDLYTMAVSVLGDGVLAEDCLQDVFVHLARKAGTLTIRGNLKGYLVTAVINRARDQLRRSVRQAGCSVEDLSLAANHGNPEQALQLSEEGQALIRVLAQLPQEQREAFVLHAQADMTFRQIGTLQQVSGKTALSRYRYAISKLQQLLQQEGVQP